MFDAAKPSAIGERIELHHKLLSANIRTRGPRLGCDWQVNAFTRRIDTNDVVPGAGRGVSKGTELHLKVGRT